MSNIYKVYWRGYGGGRALIKSRYFYSAVVFTVVLAPWWLSGDWERQALGVLSSVLGFSLGGFAILIAIGDERFRSLISGGGTDEKPSPYMAINSSFVHFIIMQILGLLYSLIIFAYRESYHDMEGVYTALKSYGVPLSEIWLAVNCFGFLLFSYAIFSALAATMGVLRVSYLYDVHRDTLSKDESKESEVSEMVEPEPGVGVKKQYN